MSDWISVDDRLPDAGKAVLVFSPLTKHNYPDDVNIAFDFIDEGIWYNHHENYEHLCCVALPDGTTGVPEKAPYTHWMPLPEPPKANNAN